MDTIILGAGCFWGVEAQFSKIAGVVKTAVGYMGGEMKDPNYNDVCTGETGHAEVVQIVFDTKIVSLSELLHIFWNCHNPTTLNRQGWDVGTQYRSVIFYYSEDQEVIAETSKSEVDRSDKFNNIIVTEITHASDFYIAEEYHQQYIAKKQVKF